MKTLIHLVRHFRFGGTETMILNICKALPEFQHLLITPECWRTNLLCKLGINLHILNSINKTCLLDKILAENPAALFHHWYPEGYPEFDKLSSLITKYGVNSFLVIHSVETDAPDVDVTQYIAVSDYVRKKNSTIPDSKIIVIKNAIQTDKYRMTIGQNSLKLIKVCRLYPERIPQDFLDPLSKLLKYPWKLFIIGSDGPMRSFIQSLINEKQLGHRITMCLNRENIPQLLKKMDIYYDFNANFHEEAWGCAITEAMASGLAVVSKNNGGISEQIENGSNGFICKNNEEITKCLLRLFKDYKYRRQIGVKARKDAILRHGIESISESYRNIISLR